VSDTTLARPVGAIGLPHISAALSDLGFDVIGGTDSVSTDVKQVRDALADRQFAVFVANPPELIPGLLGLVNNLAPRHPVVIVNFADPGPVVHAKALTIDLPDSLGSFARLVNSTLSPTMRVEVDTAAASRVVTGDAALAAVDDEAFDEVDGVSPWDAFGLADAAEHEQVETSTVSPADDTVQQQHATAPIADEPEPQASAPSADQVPSETTFAETTPQPQATPVARPLPDWMNTPAPTATPAAVEVAPTTQEVGPPHIEPPVPVTQTQEPTPPPRRRSEEPPAPPRRQGVVIACTAAKGGVLKTTMSRLLAQYAGAQGLKVVLIDANGGQDGQRKMMRVGDRLPSAYDYAVGATNWQSTICMPEEINASRPDALAPVSFATIFAPPSDVADHDIVTPDVYADLTRHAASVADVVIVDTQMIEAPAMRDPSSFARGYLVPILTEAPNRWLLSLFDNNKEAFENLIGNGTSTGVLADFIDLGVPRSNSLILATLVPESVTFDDAEFAPATAAYGRFLGHTTASASLSGSLNAGLNDYTDPAIASALRAVLRTATGLPQFEAPATQERRRLFRRGGK